MNAPCDTRLVDYTSADEFNEYCITVEQVMGTLEYAKRIAMTGEKNLSDGPFKQEVRAISSVLQSITTLLETQVVSIDVGSML